MGVAIETIRDSDEEDEDSATNALSNRLLEESEAHDRSKALRRLRQEKENARARFCGCFGKTRHSGGQSIRGSCAPISLGNDGCQVSLEDFLKKQEEKQLRAVDGSEGPKG